MDEQRLSCNICIGSNFEPYLEPLPCGRSLIRCRDCGLVAALPASGIDPAGAQTPAHRLRDGRTDLRRAAAVMRIIPEGRVLEIGCGTGSFLAGLDPARYEVVGVEPSAAPAGEARRRLVEAGARGTILECRVTEAKLTSEAFDLVAMFGTLGSSPSPRTTFMEASRLLHGGGYAVIETPGLSSLTARLCGTRWQPLSDPAAEYFFTTASLERLASLCGLSPGAAWLTLPVGWPSPGTLVYVARKSGSPVRLADLTELAPEVGKMAPMGATH